MRAARRILAAGPQKRGRSGTWIARIACGTPILCRRTAKARQTRSPARPGCVRYAGSTVGRRAAGRRPRAGGGTATISTSKTRLRCLFRRCFFLVRAPVACRRPPPAPPDRHCAGVLRSGAPGPACRTQTGRPGSRMCRDFAVRRGKNGAPPAKRTTWPPSGPIKHGRTGARDCDSSIVSAFSRPGASNPRECRRFRKLHLRICRKSPPRPRVGASDHRECYQF